MRKFLLAGLCSLAAPFLAHSQCVADPLIGSNWAYNIHTPSGGVAAIGTFRAISPGFLDVVETLNNNGAVTRQAHVNGRYILNQDCRGGEIMIMMSRAAVQLEFYLADGGLEMKLASDSWTGFINAAVVAQRNVVGRSDDAVFTGRARRLTAGPVSLPFACPAGTTNPLNVLAATTYSFAAANYGNPLHPALGYPSFLGGDTVVAGIFDATVSPIIFGGLQGNLAVTQTIARESVLQGQQPGGITRQVQSTGRFIMNADCSGGELIINTNRFAIQYEFVFAAANFSEMFLLADSTDSALLYGDAKKF